MSNVTEVGGCSDVILGELAFLALLVLLFFFGAKRVFATLNIHGGHG
jgi:hypothetical protein